MNNRGMNGTRCCEIQIRAHTAKFTNKGQFPSRYLVADRSEAGLRPAASWNLAYHLARQQRGSTSQQVSNRSATSLGPVCDQDSVMEFGLDQLRTGLRPGSICRDSSNLLEPGRRPVRSKFHYAIWSQTGPRLVADLLARAISLLASKMIGQIPARCRPATSFRPVCDQIA